MRHSWWWLKESDFDRGAYAEELPGGTWEAVVQQSAWGKGSAGIHLFVRRLDSGERFWTFIPWARHELYELFRELPDGSRIELSLRERVGQQKPRLLSARDLGPTRADADPATAHPRVPRLRKPGGEPVEHALEDESAVSPFEHMHRQA